MVVVVYTLTEGGNRKEKMKRGNERIEKYEGNEERRDGDRRKERKVERE